MIFVLFPSLEGANHSASYILVDKICAVVDENYESQRETCVRTSIILDCGAEVHTALPVKQVMERIKKAYEETEDDGLG